MDDNLNLEGAVATALPVTIARMLGPLEEHPLTRQSRRVNDPSQTELRLTYSVDGEQASFSVFPGANDTSTVVGFSSEVHKLLPGPIANDLMVLIGEEVNRRMFPDGRRKREWNYQFDEDRTFRFSLTEILRRSGRGVSAGSYNAVLESLTRLAKLRIVADKGAWRTEGKGRLQTRVVMGLVDNLKFFGREDNPGGSEVVIRISSELAQGLAESKRSLDSATYFALNGDPERRLYRMLHQEYFRQRKSVGRKPVIRIPVHYLRDRVPIAETKTPHIVRMLDRWHEALVEVGFLEAMPVYEPTTAEDLVNFPTRPGRRANMVSAIYRFGSVRPMPRGDMEVQPPALPSAPAPAPKSGRLELKARMDHVQEQLGYANIGLCKLACEAIPDDDTFFRLVSTAKQEHGSLPPTTKFVVDTRNTLVQRGLPVPPQMFDKEAQKRLLLGG